MIEPGAPRSSTGTELCFIVPVQHPDVSESYGRVLDLLGSTLRSVTRQTYHSFRVVVVLTGHRRPEFSHDAVSYLENEFPPRAFTDDEGERNRRVYQDKGSRIASGLAYARMYYGPRYVMFVDSDDFVSARLASFVAENSGPAGWYFPRGFRFSSRTLKIDLVDGFWSHCGTSHILRTDLLPLPDEVDPSSPKDKWLELLDPFYLTQVLGCHLDFKGHVESLGEKLLPLPFPGAVWHLDTDENTSRLSNHRRRGPIWGKDVTEADRVRERFGLPRRTRDFTDEFVLRLNQGKNLVARAVKPVLRLGE